MIISLGGVQDKRRQKRRNKRKKRKSEGQDWKELKGQTAPSWLWSKYPAGWSERSQETVGKKEGNKKRQGGQKG